MKQLFFGLLAFFTLAACSPNSSQENNQSNDNSQNPATTSDHKTSDPLGTWMDSKTGEVMVFTSEKIFWTKKAQEKMIELGIKSKEEGKIAVYFKNKPEKVYDMLYHSNTEIMECRADGKKLNDYERKSDNLDPAKIETALKAFLPKEVVIPNALKKYYRLKLPLTIPRTSSPENKLAAIGIKEQQTALIATENGAFILVKADIDESALSYLKFQLVNENGTEIGNELSFKYSGAMASANLVYTFYADFKIDNEKILVRQEEGEYGSGETEPYISKDIYLISPNAIKKQSK